MSRLFGKNHENSIVRFIAIKAEILERPCGSAERGRFDISELPWYNAALEDS